MDTDTVVRLARIRRLTADGTARRIRLDARMGMYELARACCINPSTIYRWETGERKPTGLPALAYLEALDAIAGGTKESAHAA